MKNTTPSGTRTFWISSPLGRIDDSMISPIGSGSSHFFELDGPSIRCVFGVSRRRSIGAAVSPNCGAAAMSRALASEDVSCCVRSSSAARAQPGDLVAAAKRRRALCDAGAHAGRFPGRCRRSIVSATAMGRVFRSRRAGGRRVMASRAAGCLAEWTRRCPLKYLPNNGASVNVASTRWSGVVVQAAAILDACSDRRRCPA